MVDACGDYGGFREVSKPEASQYQGEDASLRLVDTQLLNVQEVLSL